MQGIKNIFICLILLGFTSSCISQPDYDRKRKQMVEFQIKARGITDTRVLKAMRKVERYLFVPEPLKEQLAEGGRMIIPVGGRDIQYLVLNRKIRGKVKQNKVLPVRFVPMVGDKGIRY